MKKLISLLLCLLLLAGLAIPAAASEETLSDVSTVSDTGTGGDTTGGNPGGDTTGGNTGGDSTGGNPGGDTTGGNPGGDTTGGNPGGDTTGGNTGGDTTGGNPGGDTTGGNPGGDTTGGNPGGDTTGGNSGGDTTGGNPGGDTTGGNPGGDTTGGTTGSNPCANGHTWVSVTIPATCKEDGAKGTACGVCATVLEAELIPKLTTHTYDNNCDTTCNVCGLTREITHNYSTVWSKNGKGHWHACSVCGAQKDFGSHYPGPAATEEKAQICLTCGYTLTAKLKHTHKYETQWTSDENSHWYACEGCEEKKSLDSHVYDNACDPDCNTCGYLTDTAHAYEDTWLMDETGHWSVCTLCGEESKVEAHIPGPEATEEEAQICTLCSFEIAPALAHVHEPGESWLSDEANHWKECECGEKVEEASHAWDEGTENEDTTVTYICTECQAEKTEGEPKTEKPFPWGIVLAVLGLACAGAVTALVLVLRKGKAAGKYGK